MSWQDVLTQLELDAAAYEQIAVDPDAPLPAAWSTASVHGPPPAELVGRLTAALNRLETAERALVVAKVRTSAELASLVPTAPPIARYLDTTA